MASTGQQQQKPCPSAACPHTQHVHYYSQPSQQQQSPPVVVTAHFGVVTDERKKRNENVSSTRTYTLAYLLRHARSFLPASFNESCSMHGKRKGTRAGPHLKQRKKNKKRGLRLLWCFMSVVARAQHVGLFMYTFIVSKFGQDEKEMGSIQCLL